MHPIVDFANKVLGVKLYDGQARVISDYHNSGLPHWLLLAGRRSGKSLLADIEVLYDAVVEDHSASLRPDETRFILLMSTRNENASIHVKAISKLLKHSKDLRKMVVKETQDSIELSNGVQILSLPASARSTRGFTASLVVLDELSYFIDAGGNSSASEVFQAIEPTVSTFERGRIVITTSVASRTGVVYELFEANHSGEGDFFVTRVSSREMNPKVSERAISAAMRRDEESALAEFYSQFRDPIEAFLNPDLVDACVDRGLSEAYQAERGRTYCMSIDPAIVRDSFAFCVGHRDGERYVIDHLSTMKPPVDVAAADARIFELAKRFRPAVVKCDNAALVARLKPKLPALVYEAFTRAQKLRIFSALKESVNLQLLTLPPNPDAVAELKSLQIRNGNDIGAPRSGRVVHDDYCDVVALVVESLSSGHYHAAGPGWVPNFFETTDQDPDDLEVIRAWEMESGRPWGDAWHIHAQPHPDGVTWQSCPYRTKPGCLSCHQELSAEREREREYLQSKAPMSEEVYQQWRDALHHPYIDPGDVVAEQRAARSVKEFWKQAKGRVRDV